MSIAAVCLLCWLVIVLFAVVPKRFTIVEMFFLYFVSSILTVAIFTIFDINLHWVPASRDVEKGLALHLCRFVEIPLLLIIGADKIINFPLKSLTRWLIAAAVPLFLTINDWILVSLGILIYREWNYLFAFIDYGLFLIVMCWIARWFTLLDKRGMEKA